MKIFISHQKLDTDLAIRISQRLKAYHAINSYVDAIDLYVGRRPEELADYIRRELGKCTQLIAVISHATAQSQWVPWEIGVATEKDFPLATFSGGNAVPPEFIRKWPYLRTDDDLDAYARTSKKAATYVSVNKGALSESVARARSTRDFYVELRSSLGQ